MRRRHDPQPPSGGPWVHSGLRLPCIDGPYPQNPQKPHIYAIRAQALSHVDGGKPGQGSGAAATTRRHRCRQEPATKLTGGTQCACLAALFGQPAVHTSQAHSAPSNLPKIYIYVPCTPHTLTCTAGSLGRLGKRACRLPAGGCRWSRGKAGRVSRDRQAALPGGSARCPRLRSFPEPCAVAGGPRGPPSAAAGGAGRDPCGRGAARKTKRSALINFVAPHLSDHGIGHLAQCCPVL